SDARSCSSVTNAASPSPSSPTPSTIFLAGGSRMRRRVHAGTSTASSREASCRERQPLRMGWSRLAQHVATASPPCPVLPGALGLGRIGLVARVAGVDLAERQWLHL